MATRILIKDASFISNQRTFVLNCSVRIGNELGAGHPKVAKFSVIVVNATSIIISIVFSAIVLGFRVGLSKLFTSDTAVIDAVINLTPLLASSVFLNGIQPILSGQTVTFYASAPIKGYSYKRK